MTMEVPTEPLTSASDPVDEHAVVAIALTREQVVATAEADIDRAVLHHAARLQAMFEGRFELHVDKLTRADRFWFSGEWLAPFPYLFCRYKAVTGCHLVKAFVFRRSADKWVREATN